ncbi:MAG TPA: hypothetical protein DEA08_07460, partial [Planctomycetes bacterium]|nr:hypothetical protein [Planctomycetota bacterium]
MRRLGRQHQARPSSRLRMLREEPSLPAPKESVRLVGGIGTPSTTKATTRWQPSRQRSQPQARLPRTIWPLRQRLQRGPPATLRLPPAERAPLSDCVRLCLGVRVEPCPRAEPPRPEGLGLERPRLEGLEGLRLE